MPNAKILLTEHQASKLMGFKVSTLRKRRCKGKAPRFLKIGSNVRYDANDIQQYLDSCVRESTSQRECI